jgi:DNA-directed RNA polymerase specialized sigma24 family protein
MAKRGPKPKKTEYYIDPVEFKQQLVDYYKSNINEEIIATSISKIAYGLSYSSNFINYSYKDEMIGDAIVKMFTAVKNKKFNVDSEYNPFSYFTTIAFHAFINRIKKEKKHAEALSEYKSRFYEQEMMNSSDANIYIKPVSVESDDLVFSSDE